MAKVLITPRSFAAHSQAPYELLKEAGIEVVANPVRGILTKKDMLTHMKEVDGVILGVDPLDADVLAVAKNLSVVAKYGVGTDNIDLDYCQAHNIDVKITRNANSDAVSDYAFALMLAVARRVVEIDKCCRTNDWSKKVANDVYGKKLGILGLGAIGKGVAKRAIGFNMELYAYDVTYDEKFMTEHNILQASVETILAECDFISLHLPLTPKTKHLINAKSLASSKENLIIINTARGEIINESDLYNALKNGRFTELELMCLKLNQLIILGC